MIKERKGQTMLLTSLALSGTLLGATTIAGLLLVYQIRQSTDLENSARAIYAADAGIEAGMYNFFVASSPLPPTGFSNKAAVTVTCRSASSTQINCNDNDVWYIEAKGTAGPVSRAFQMDLQ